MAYLAEVQKEEGCVENIGQPLELLLHKDSSCPTWVLWIAIFHNGFGLTSINT